MEIHTIRLRLGIMFLILGTVILTRGWVMPGLNAQFNPTRMSLGGVFALVLGGLNIARWYAVWSYRQARATPVRTPFQRDPSIVAPEPPNPGLDFTKDQKPGQERQRGGDDD